MPYTRKQCQALAENIQQMASSLHSQRAQVNALKENLASIKADIKNQEYNRDNAHDDHERANAQRKLGELEDRKTNVSNEIRDVESAIAALLNDVKESEQEHHRNCIGQTV